MKKIEEIESKIKDLLKEVESLKQQEHKFEVGKWYYSKIFNDEWLVNFKEIKGDDLFSNSAICLGATPTWYNASEWGSYSDCKVFRPATTQEVEEALIKEAKKRGFKEGVRFKALNQEMMVPVVNFSSIDNELKFMRMSFRLNKINDLNTLLVSCNDSRNNGIIFHNGQWAEIIKEDKIMIAGHEVKFRTDGAVDVGCKTIHEIELRNISDLMKRCGFTWIQFDKEHTVNIETIDKILDKL